MLSSCGSTEIRESHLFQVRDNSGEISYYRVNVKATAHLAKVEYRAGLYDARKLNYLLNEVSLNLNDDVPNGKTSSSKEKSKNTDDAEEQETAATELDNPKGQNEQDGITSDPDRAKFAIVLSTRASEIEEALSSMVEEEETTRLILGNLEGQKRGEIIDEQMDLIAVNNRINSLRELTEATKNELPGADGAQRAESLKKIKSWLESIAGTTK